MANSAVKKIISVILKASLKISVEVVPRGVRHRPIFEFASNLITLFAFYFVVSSTFTFHSIETNQTKQYSIREQ